MQTLSRAAHSMRDITVKMLQAIPRALRWTRASYLALGVFAVTMLVVMALWWPLVAANLGSFDLARSCWKQWDWFLFGNFLGMLLLIMGGADARTDVPIFVVSTLGGLAIESWGTHTGLWTYFTRERPPLWVIPAWPVASLAIDRLTRGACVSTSSIGRSLWSFSL